MGKKTNGWRVNDNKILSVYIEREPRVSIPQKRDTHTKILEAFS